MLAFATQGRGSSRDYCRALTNPCYRAPQGVKQTAIMAGNTTRVFRDSTSQLEIIALDLYHALLVCKAIYSIIVQDPMCDSSHFFCSIRVCIVYFQVYNPTTVQLECHFFFLKICVWVFWTCRKPTKYSKLLAACILYKAPQWLLRLWRNIILSWKPLNGKSPLQVMETRLHKLLHRET